VVEPPRTGRVDCKKRLGWSGLEKVDDGVWAICCGEELLARLNERDRKLNAWTRTRATHHAGLDSEPISRPVNRARPIPMPREALPNCIRSAELCDDLGRWTDWRREAGADS
jgi:hypothetical protein